MLPEEDPRSPAVRPALKSVETWIVLFLLVIDSLQGAHLINLADSANQWMHGLAIAVVIARTWLKVAGVQGSSRVASAEALPRPAIVPATAVVQTTEVRDAKADQNSNATTNWPLPIVLLFLMLPFAAGCKKQEDQRLEALLTFTTAMQQAACSVSCADGGPAIQPDICDSWKQSIAAMRASLERSRR